MIAIVGGGISGLAVAHHLERAGAEIVVLEARDRPGGVIGSITVQGRVLELGPQRTRLTPSFQRLVDRLGLGPELLVAPELPLFIQSGGRLRPVPLDLRTALTTDLIGWRDRLRVLLEPLTAGLRPDETAADFFTRKLGRRTYERVIAPLYGGLYASDPADMPARHALAPTLEALGVRRSLLRAIVRGARGRARAPACSFRAGLQVLTDALAHRFGGRVRLKTPVREIHAEGAGFRILLEGDELRADRVVLACPADAAARALRPLAPGAADRLERLRYNPLALVHLLADGGPRGLGFQVASSESMATRGVTFNHALFGRDRVHTAFLGGATRPDVPDLPDAELGALAARELTAVTGQAARPIHVHRTRMPAWDHSWDALSGFAIPAGIHVCASWRARPGITGRLIDAERLAASLAGGAAGAGLRARGR